MTITRASLSAAWLGTLVFAAGPLARPVASGGTIVGIVTTRAAASRPFRVTIDPGVCGETMPDESLAVDASGHVAGAVVTVAGVKAMAPAEAAVVNEGCRIAPRVLTLRPNGVVRMTSKDPVLHTMHAAAASGKPFFNLSLPIQNVALSRPIDKPGVVTLSCSTHTWMRGYLYVTEELSAISAADGSFRLEGVPAGPHDVRIWHEALKAAPIHVTVAEGQTVTVDVSLVK